MLSDCDGCLSNCVDCFSINYKAKDRCPCRECVVKVTCDDVCYKFYDYVLERNGYTSRHGVAVFRTTIMNDGTVKSAHWDDERTERLKENERTM